MARKATATKAVEATIAEVRAWALAEGLPIGSRGHLSAVVREQFTAQTGRPIVG